MRAIVLDRPGSFRVAELPDPAPAASEVVVRVDCCDLRHGSAHPGRGVPADPVPDHARSRVLRADRRLRARHQAWTARRGQGRGGPLAVCGWCRRCRAGRGNLCENWGAIGATVNGAFAEYVAVPAANVYRLPDQIDGQAGAMAEPLACVVHGLRRLGSVLGRSVVVVGAGPMALLLLQLLLGAGAGVVPVVNRVATRSRSRAGSALTRWPATRANWTAPGSTWLSTRPAFPPRSPCRRSASTTTRSPLSGRWPSCAASARPLIKWHIRPS